MELLSLLGCLSVLIGFYVALPEVWSTHARDLSLNRRYSWFYHEMDRRSKIDLPEQCITNPAAPCENPTTSWHYDHSLHSCVRTSGGACANARNSHRSREDCLKACYPEVCELPMNMGTCRETVSSWYFDVASKTCKQFDYGGCQGNENRFETEAKCRTTCAESHPQQCTPTNLLRPLSLHAVTHGYREQLWYVFDGHTQCQARCLDMTFPWGTCMAASIRDRWWGYTCYLFDSRLSYSMVNPSTRGMTWNRTCTATASAVVTTLK